MRDASQDRIAEIPPDRGAEWAPRRTWQAPVSLEERIFASTVPAAGEEVQVYGNHGRWVVECPDCGGAQLACRTDHRFMCNECANIAVGGLWRPVVWPDNVQAIEAEMESRPEKNQNWLPGETLEQLRDEASRAARQQQAESYEGHTHVWPKAPSGPFVECRECGLVAPSSLIDWEA